MAGGSFIRMIFGRAKTVMQRIGLLILLLALLPQFALFSFWLIGGMAGYKYWPVKRNYEVVNPKPTLAPKGAYWTHSHLNKSATVLTKYGGRGWLLIKDSCAPEYKPNESKKQEERLSTALQPYASSETPLSQPKKQRRGKFTDPTPEQIEAFNNGTSVFYKECVLDVKWDEDNRVMVVDTNIKAYFRETVDYQGLFLLLLFAGIPMYFGVVDLIFRAIVGLGRWIIWGSK